MGRRLRRPARPSGSAEIRLPRSLWRSSAIRQDERDSTQGQSLEDTRSLACEVQIGQSPGDVQEHDLV
jgi:hypothetical protein